MRFGLVGTGYWARQTQGAALAAHPDVELVGVWGRRVDAARELAAHLQCQAYAELDDLIADVEAVAFAVPPDVQAELATRAATAGRHLLLDKPIALDVGAADRLVAAVEGSRVRSVVFFTRRFVPEIADWLAGPGSGGGWVAGEATMHASIFEPGGPYANSQWRKDRGALWDVGPHALSMTVPVLGRVESVAGRRGVGDTVAVSCRHAGGGVSTMLLSLTAPAAAVANRITFYGRAGVAEPVSDTDAVTAFGHCISALLGPEPHPCDVRFGREVVSTLAAVEAVLG